MKMATPMTNDQMLNALKAEGLQVCEHANWRNHSRNHVGSWGPINGVMVHHTGSDVQGENYVRNILRNGYSGLPGPLCHVGVDMAGVVHLVSNGRANHAGGGDKAVHNAVINEAPWLMEREAKPRVGNRGGYVGNANYYGEEVMYDGGQPMTPRQKDAAVRYAAAICRFYGWSARSVIGHREWSSDKPDPGKESMVAFRKLVQARLDAAPAREVSAAATATATAPRGAGQGRPISCSAYERGVASGKPAGNVRIVQKALAAQKRNGVPYYAGELDGIAGPVLKQAIRDWQLAIGDDPKYADGVLGINQFTRLMTWDGWKVVK